MKILQFSEAAIAEAVDALKRAELVAFPTETVYGLGADATNLKAVERLYKAKGRPADHPVIVHVFTTEHMSKWAKEIPEAARKLTEALCPGPLTVILPKAPAVLSQITGGQDSVALRVPQHPIARRLLERFGGGLVAPSANKFGRLSPTTADDVAHDFEHEVSIVLDGGTCEVGIESTIVDFTGQRARILRPGMIIRQQIEAIIGPIDGPAHAAPLVRVPGALPVHYAPHTPTALVESAQLAGKLRALVESGKRVCVLAFQEDFAACAAHIVASTDPARYAHDLYGNLRKLDRVGADVILVEAVPQTDAWAGVADRLTRASSDGHGQS